MADPIEERQDLLQHIPVASISWGRRFREDMGDIENLAESIREKGVLQPITVCPDGNGMYKLLAGQRRYTAAKKIGLVMIPALVRPRVDEVDDREIELMENVFRNDFTWDEEAALILEIDRLYKQKDYNWSGRKTAQLLQKSKSQVNRALQLAQAAEVIPEIKNSKTADDALKLLKKLEENAIVDEMRRRQVNNMEKPGVSMDYGVAHMLKIADANYHIEDVFGGLHDLKDNGYIQLIECDPPYGIGLTKVKASKDSVDSNVHTYNEIPAEKYEEFLRNLAKELYRVAGRDCWLIFWFGPSWQREVFDALVSAGWLVDEIPAIWCKPTGQTLQPEVYLARSYEPFYVCRKGKPVLFKRGHLNVFTYPNDSKKYHPTQRPIKLMEELLSVFAAANCVVLSPFLGSGVTLRAAYNLGMKGWGYDLSEEYKAKFMLAVEEDTRKINADSNGKSEDTEDRYEGEELTEEDLDNMAAFK